EFYAGYNSTLVILSGWDSSNADIDVMVMDPSGRIFSPKKQKVLGQDVPEMFGNDSHATPGPPNSTEELVVNLTKSGDYLVFYHVPNNATPADYASLYGFAGYHDTRYGGNGKGTAVYWRAAFGDALASKAKPGGYYAWIVITYDSDKEQLSTR